MEDKKWYLSKTILINIIQIILDILALFGWFFPVVGPVVGIVCAALNIVFRVLKVLPLTW